MFWSGPAIPISGDVSGESRDLNRRQDNASLQTNAARMDGSARHRGTGLSGCHGRTGHIERME